MKFSRFITSTLAIIGTVAIANYAVKAIKRIKEDCTDDECCIHNTSDDETCCLDDEHQCDDKVTPETEKDNKEEAEFEYSLKEKEETSEDEQ